MTSPSDGHTMMAPDDPDSPMNWSLYTKTYTSLVAFLFAFQVTFAATAYTAGVNDVAKEFHLQPIMEPYKAVVPLSVYLFGVFFAPIYTPHLSERFGRRPIYFIATFTSALFIIGAGFSQTFASLVVCRFFAGLFGGPSVVLIEGTFADIWPAKYTNTYYAFIGFAQYTGAAFGPVILGFIVPVESWRWTQFVTLMLQLAVLLVAIGVPETYQREIIRRRARRAGTPHNLAPAASGTTFASMAEVTFINPVKLTFTDPLVMSITIYVGFAFGVVFQWFILVPAVLSMTYNYTPQKIGLAFLSAVVGTFLAAVTSILIEQFALRVFFRNKTPPLEHRLMSAMFGGLFLLASLFWIANTAAPNFNPLVPITGTGAYVFGNMLVLISLVPYIFDAFPPRGTLSALTIMATFRLAMAGVVPLVILQFVTNLHGGKWPLMIFGFIQVPFMLLPFALFFLGPKLRASSRFSSGMKEWQLAGMTAHEMHNGMGGGA
ncbi:MFS general substrate transporter [Viridothelium virens]|uniref:MFS general substrate transporter n=1 Tax=Viridothelium virens TaxID=1048519 RepID=A0A6A6HFX6_VIRVR|nr:MFS general substrate transporter [Viridothelium virens]